MKLKAYHPQYRKLESLAKRERDADQHRRYRIILALARGLGPSQVQSLLGAARSTVLRLRSRFEAEGIRGLRDRRSERSADKVTEAYLIRLTELIHETPRQYGWQRSTWTRELLGKQLQKETGIDLHRSHIGRLLSQQEVHWGRARPIAKQWMSAQNKAAKMRKINHLLLHVPRNEVVLYQDEVDIHLNPKIGSAWMPRGMQMEIETPGINQKRYVFGGLNAVTGQVTYTVSEHKRATGFIDWLKAVSVRYKDKSAVHVICDNFAIHKTRDVKATLQDLKTIRLHFLPPYSPDENRIELLWKQLHAAVTRNHCCKTMAELMEQVVEFLDRLRRHGWKAQRIAGVAHR